MNHTTAAAKLKSAADKTGVVSVLALCGNNLKQGRFGIPVSKT